MTTLAVTGHINLTESTVPLVREALVSVLGRYPAEQLVGVSCMAEGSDALFADAVLRVGGSLIAVIPSRDYRQHMVGPHYVTEFDRLCRAAAEVRFMPHRRATEAAYSAANWELLHRAESLLAVWDGSPGRGRGGTADMVAMAHSAGVPVEVVWPAGAARKVRQRQTARRRPRLF